MCFLPLSRWFHGMSVAQAGLWCSQTLVYMQRDEWNHWWHSVKEKQTKRSINGSCTKVLPVDLPVGHEGVQAIIKGDYMILIYFGSYSSWPFVRWKEFFFFLLKFQTPVTLCSGHRWIVVVKLATLCRPDVWASDPCVGLVHQVLLTTRGVPEWMCL